MPVLSCVRAAAILRCVTPSVWCHPYLKTPDSLLVMIEFLQQEKSGQLPSIDCV